MSDFWVRKIKRFYRIFDSNNDGVVTIEDFELLAKRYGEGATDERKKAVREILLKLFATFNAVAGTDGKITEEQMIEGARKLRDDPAYVDVLKEVAVICYGLLDSDGDGIIQEAEYARLFYNHSIPDHERLAKISFKALDTNGDGKLNFEETSTGFYDYLLSDDETRPGSIFFGPLP